MAESNGNQPVTQNELKEELRALEQRLEERFDGRLDSLEERMIRTFTILMAQTKTEILEKTQEQVRDAQTELLRGFEAFAKS